MTSRRTFRDFLALAILPPWTPPGSCASTRPETGRGSRSRTASTSRACRPRPAARWSRSRRARRPLTRRWWRRPDGSSSGSAVAVAAGEADVALGTDTGGSVRIPAACCGITGLKTTWGRVPLDGVYPLALSMDTVGPLGADVAAVELGMRLVDPGFTGASAEAPARVGRIRPAPDIGVDPATDAAVDAALAGVQVTDVTGFDFRAVDQAGNVSIDVEAYQANAHLLPRLDQLAPHNRRSMTEAAQITAEEAAEAARVRQELRDWFAAALDRHPVLALPTLVGAPPLLGERGMSLAVLTMPANLAGLPALALPVPRGPAGLPASLQLIGPPGGEERLIALGRVIEAALR